MGKAYIWLRLLLQYYTQSTFCYCRMTKMNNNPMHTHSVYGLPHALYKRHLAHTAHLYWMCQCHVTNDIYIYTISYPLFASADTGIYPHAASQYHARPKVKRGIAILSMDKFPYPGKQTRGNEFIPCSNNICDILKRFRSFKIPAITLIWPKSSYKHSVTRSYRSGKECGRRSESSLWRHQWRPFVFISHADDVKREIRLHISRLLTNQTRESARSMG